jgi:hypothetical protein
LDQLRCVARIAASRANFGQSALIFEWMLGETVDPPRSSQPDVPHPAFGQRVSRWDGKVHIVRQHIIAVGDVSLSTTTTIPNGATITSGYTANHTHDSHLQRNLP